MIDIHLTLILLCLVALLPVTALVLISTRGEAGGMGRRRE